MDPPAVRSLPLRRTLFPAHVDAAVGCESMLSISITCAGVLYASKAVPCGCRSVACLSTFPSTQQQCSAGAVCQRDWAFVCLREWRAGLTCVAMQPPAFMHRGPPMPVPRPGIGGPMSAPGHYPHAASPAGPAPVGPRGVPVSVPGPGPPLPAHLGHGHGHGHGPLSGPGPGFAPAHGPGPSPRGAPVIAGGVPGATPTFPPHLDNLLGAMAA